MSVPGLSLLELKGIRGFISILRSMNPIIICAATCLNHFGQTLLQPSLSEFYSANHVPKDKAVSSLLQLVAVLSSYIRNMPKTSICSPVYVSKIACVAFCWVLSALCSFWLPS